MSVSEACWKKWWWIKAILRKATSATPVLQHRRFLQTTRWRQLVGVTQSVMSKILYYTNSGITRLITSKHSTMATPGLTNVFFSRKYPLTHVTRSSLSKILTNANPWGNAVDHLQNTHERQPMGHYGQSSPKYPPTPVARDRGDPPLLRCAMDILWRLRFSRLRQAPAREAWYRRRPV